jgi:hypothetical protein
MEMTIVYVVLHNRDFQNGQDILVFSSLDKAECFVRGETGTTQHELFPEWSIVECPIDACFAASATSSS